MNVKITNRALWLRALALVLALVLLIMAPVRAYATGAGLAAGGAWVVANADIVIPGIIAALGVWAGAESGLFEWVVESCTTAMTELGHVVDGFIDVYVLDGLSYVSEDLLSVVRDWLFDEGVVTENEFYGYPDRCTVLNGTSITFPSPFPSNTKSYVIEGNCTIYAVCKKSINTDTNRCSFSANLLVCGDSKFLYNGNSVGSYDSTYDLYLYSVSMGALSYELSDTRYQTTLANLTNYHDLTDLWAGGLTVTEILDYFGVLPEYDNTAPYVTDYDLTLGNVAATDQDICTVYTDVTVGIVLEDTGSGDSGDDENNKTHKYWPVSVKQSDPNLNITQEEAQAGETDLEVETETDTDTETDTKTDSDTNSGSSDGSISQVQAASFWETLGNLFTTYIVNPIKDFWTKSIALMEAGVFWETLTQTISDAITGVLSDLFVPSEGFVEAKIEALTSKYAFAESIACTGDYFNDFFGSIGAQPPVIYIDLGSTEGSYDIGGKTVFLDLTWYSEYKPTMDVIISAILLLWFAWRIYLAAPGIIQGTSGFWGAPDSDSTALTVRERDLH